MSHSNKQRAENYYVQSCDFPLNKTTMSGQHVRWSGGVHWRTVEYFWQNKAKQTLQLVPEINPQQSTY